MWQFIKQYPSKYWPYYVIGIISLILTNIALVSIPLQIRNAIDQFVQQQNHVHAIQHTLLILIGLAIALLIFRTLSRVMFFIPGRNVEFNIRNDLYTHLLKCPSRLFRNESVGDIMSRLINDIQGLRVLVALACLHIINTTLTYTLVIYQMVSMNPLLTLWVLCPIPISLICVRGLTKLLYTFTRKNQFLLGKLTNFIVENLGSIVIVKNYGMERVIQTLFEKENLDFLDNSIKLAKVRSSIFPVIGIIGSLGQLILFVLGGKLIIEGQLTIGEFTAFSTYVLQIIWPTVSLGWIINIIQRGRVSLKRIQDLLEIIPDPDPDTPFNPIHKTTTPPNLTIKNLSFSYKETPVLHNLSFHIKSGKKCGVFGTTGSGKSTLAQLLSGLEKAPHHTYFINDVPIENIPIGQFWKDLTYVPQTPYLFSETIADAISFSAEKQPDTVTEKIRQAAKTACFTKDIHAFSKSYDTLIGEKGVILSGGQKKRLALARALYKEHKLLIIDDVLSALDHEIEHHINRNLHAHQPDCTSIIISNRISALEHCDHILVLDKGAIIDHGTHTSLIQKEGLYKDTWEYQQLEEHLERYDN